MKRQYSKPGIIIEDFSVAEHIASCAGVQHENYWGTPLTSDIGSCEWLGPDGRPIFSTSSVCKTESLKEGSTPGTFGNYCYNGPIGQMSVFGS